MTADYDFETLCVRKQHVATHSGEIYSWFLEEEYFIDFGQNPPSLSCRISASETSIMFSQTVMRIFKH